MSCGFVWESHYTACVRHCPTPDESVHKFAFAVGYSTLNGEFNRPRWCSFRWNWYHIKSASWMWITCTDSCFMTRHQWCFKNISNMTGTFYRNLLKFVQFVTLSIMVNTLEPSLPSIWSNFIRWTNQCRLEKSCLYPYQGKGSLSHDALYSVKCIPMLYISHGNHRYAI